MNTAAYNGHPSDQPAIPHESLPPVLTMEQAGLGPDMRERLLSELPVVQIGNTDPLNPTETTFPNVLYHGSRQDFDLDDSLTHRTTPNRTGNRTGKGFYCAAAPVAELYETGAVAEILPQLAHIIDLTSPQADEPLSEDFRAAFTAYQTGRLSEAEDPIVTSAMAFATSAERRGALVGRQEVVDYARSLSTSIEADRGTQLSYEDKALITNALTTTFSRWNTISIVQDPDTSLRTLFATHNSASGESKYRDAQVQFDIAESLDFIVGELGIDGAKTIQTFEPIVAEESSDEWLDDEPENPERQAKEAAVLALSPDEWHGYVFWKLDKVGDRALWERRTKDAPRLGATVLDVESSVEYLAA